MLLTDVEGSTVLWEEHPLEMRHAMQRDHEIGHDAISRHFGYLPPDQGEGDSLFAVFSDAREGVACALEFQRGLAAEDWGGGLTIKGPRGTAHRIARSPERAIGEGAVVRGTRLLGAAESLMERLGAALPPCEREDVRAAMDAAQVGLGPARLAAELIHRRALTLDETVRLAVSDDP